MNAFQLFYNSIHCMSMSKLEIMSGQAHTCCGLGSKLKVGRGPAPAVDSDTADTDYRYSTLDPGCCIQ